MKNLRNRKNRNLKKFTDEYKVQVIDNRFNTTYLPLTNMQKSHTKIVMNLARKEHPNAKFICFICGDTEKTMNVFHRFCVGMMCDDCFRLQLDM